jgi:hypothetical protein
MLLACAAFLAIGQVLVGPPRRPLPDLVVLAATALVPVVIGVRIVQTPGAASAICGAYLLPASTLSLLLPSIPPPPLLLVPAVAFDLVLWLEPEHLRNLLRRSRQRTSGLASRTRPRAILAGGAFGLVLGLIEPPFRLFLGGDPNVWTEPLVAFSAALAAAVCAGVALLSVRGRAA